MKLSDAQRQQLADFMADYVASLRPYHDETAYFADRIAPLIESWLTDPSPASCPECEAALEHCSACGATFRSWEIQ